MLISTNYRYTDPGYYLKHGLRPGKTGYYRQQPPLMPLGALTQEQKQRLMNRTMFYGAIGLAMIAASIYLAQR